MELYHKVGVSHITTIATYEDMSVKQVCYDSMSKEVQMYRACPDVEDGACFLRVSKFTFDFNDLDQVINIMPHLKDTEEPLYEVAVKHSKRLVYMFNEQFRNWELGFQKKRMIQKRKACVIDLEEEDVETMPKASIQVKMLKPDYEFELNRYESIKFKKAEDFEFMIDRLIEFRRDVLNDFPYLRKGNVVISDDSEEEISDAFLKQNIELFRYLTFQINYDKEMRSVSRIALLRQYANDLKAITNKFDVNRFIRNKKKIYEYCRILRATRNAARCAEGASTSGYKN